MINHVWTVVCQNAIIDRETNFASIINVFEGIEIAKDPRPEGFLTKELNVITLWARSQDDTPSTWLFRLVFESPSQIQLGSFNGEIDFGTQVTGRSIFQFAGLPLPENGTYHFCVELFDKENDTFKRVSKTPIMVEFVGEPEGKVTEGEV